MIVLPNSDSVIQNYKVLTDLNSLVIYEHKAEKFVVHIVFYFSTIIF